MPAISSLPLLCPRCGMSVEVADRFCRGCGAPLGAAASGHELRKTVTVVFCDLVGSTALGERLDAEALRHLLGRYYAEMRAVLERHGGLVEKFIGDAVVAVFGVPLVHEDDALRAVRAAVEMRSTLEVLNDELERQSGVRVGVRIGVNTGEVVAGDLGPGASFASGDAVNVAARLEQAAGPAEILVGGRTRLLLGDVVEVGTLEPLELHGKSEPVEAFRLLSVAADAEAIVRHFETAFVGRELELGVLREVFEEAMAEPGCRLLTVLGEPGTGKTRLLREFARSVSDRVRVLRGSCLPYGEGITFWPLREILHELCAGDEMAAELRSWLASDEQAEQIAGLLLGAIGASEDPGGSVEEVQWAVRRLFEALAAERPLLILLEDLHWAEATFLQLVEYVNDCATSSAILLLAAAREELLDTTPAWALPHPRSRLLALEPLPESAARRLVDALAGDHPVAEQVRARVLGTGGGNPLFLEQLVALQAEDGNQNGELRLPATISALLAARLDRLPTTERDVLERAAVEGVTFHRGSLNALLPDHEAVDVGALLLDAVRRNLIRSCRSQLPGDDGYEFVHVLVRDAVYDSMPKELRAQLHEQFADTLEQILGSRSSELEEILGHHLERAAQAKQQLGRPDAALARRARERLASAGRRALWRADYPSAAPLLERALTLLEPDELDVALELDLHQALYFSHRLPEAYAQLERAAARAAAAGDRSAQFCLELTNGITRLYMNPEAGLAPLEALIAEALPALSADDHLGLQTAYAAAWAVAAQRGRDDDALAAGERVLDELRLAGRHEQEPFWLGCVGISRINGSTPVPEIVAWLDEQDAAGHPNPLGPDHRAWVLAALGRFDEARALLDAGRAEVIDKAAGFTLAFVNAHSAGLELLLGEPEAAAELAAESCRGWEEIGEHNNLSASYAFLAEAQYQLGRIDEAEESVRRATDVGDPLTTARARQTEAKILASRGRHAAAEQLARETVAIADQTQSLKLQADTYFSLGEVLALADDTKAARSAYEQAAARYERKGIIPLARSTRERLATLQPA